MVGMHMRKTLSNVIAVLLIAALISVGGFTNLAVELLNAAPASADPATPATLADSTGGARYDILTETTKQDSTLTVNGALIGDDDTVIVSNGDAFRFWISFALVNGATYTPSDVFYYKIPEGLNLSNKTSGTLTAANGTETGTWRIADGYLTFQYTDAFLDQSNRETTFALEGTFDVEAGKDYGDDVTFTLIGGKEYTVKVRNDVGLTIKKDAQKVVDQDAHRVYVDYTVTLTADKDNTNVVITDTIAGGSATLIDSSAQTTTTGGASIPVRGDGMNWTVEEMPKGSTVTLAYRVETGDNISTTSATFTNTAQAESTEVSTVQATTSTYVRQVSLAKTGEKLEDAYRWTITVRPGEFNSFSLRDSMGAGNVYDDDATVAVTRHLQDGTSAVCATPTFGDLRAGYTYTEAATVDMANVDHYTLVYDTPATPDQLVINNAVQETNMGSRWIARAQITNGVVGDWWIRKASENVDEVNRTITWNITFNVPERCESLFIDDIIYKDSNLSHAISPDTAGGATPGEVTLTKADGTTVKASLTDASVGGRWIVQIGVSDGLEAGTYSLQVTSTYDPEGYTGTNLRPQLVNRVELSADGSQKVYTQGYANPHANYITKAVASQGVYEGSKYYIDWTIRLADSIPAGSTATITDTLPDGLSFVSATFNGSSVDPTVNSGNTLTFDVSGATSGQSIVVRTEVDGWVGGGFTEQRDFANIAQITVGKAEYPVVTATATVDPPDLIDKTGTYNTSTAPYIDYTVTVNNNAIDLVPDGGTIEVRDTLGTALRFVEGSLKVDGESWASYTVHGDTLTISGLADGKQYTITYQALVLKVPGAQLSGSEATNSVSIVGIGADAGSAGTTYEGTVQRGTASTSSSVLTARIYKHDEAYNPLAGAQFAVYSYGSAAYPEAETERTLVYTFESDENGAVTNVRNVDGDLVLDANGDPATSLELGYDTIYRIVETKAPEGYDVGADTGLFVRPGNNGTEYADNIMRLDGYYEYLFEFENPPHRVALPETGAGDYVVGVAAGMAAVVASAAALIGRQGGGRRKRGGIDRSAQETMRS